MTGHFTKNALSSQHLVVMAPDFQAGFHAQPQHCRGKLTLGRLALNAQSPVLYLYTLAPLHLHYAARNFCQNGSAWRLTSPGVHHIMIDLHRHVAAAACVLL